MKLEIHVDRLGSNNNQHSANINKVQKYDVYERDILQQEGKSIEFNVSFMTAEQTNRNYMR